MKKLTLFSFIILLSVGCTIQKRLYNPGYNISWNKRIKSASKDDEKPLIEDLTLINEAIKPIDTIQAEPIQYIVPVDTLKKCDNIVFNDGNEINGVVTEITETEVKYKSCENPTGPLYTVSKSKVLMVKYSNGTKEVFKKEEPVKSVNNEEKKKKKIEPFSLIGFILAMINLPLLFLLAPYAGFILGGICALYGIIGILRISLKKEKFRGAGFAVFSLILGIVSIILTAAIFL